MLSCMLTWRKQPITQEMMIICSIIMISITIINTIISMIIILSQVVSLLVLEAAPRLHAAKKPDMKATRVYGV